MTFIADRVTNVPVPFRQLRMKDAESALQEGVVGATDLKVVQRAAGADQSVDFSVGAGWIRIDSGTRNGLAHFYNDAVANIAATAANGTNPRVDIAVVRYNDSSIPAGTGGNTPTPEILPGTATAGAQITNTAGANYRAGAPALPNDCILLADILRPTATNPITTANIVDRRPWARGAYRRIIRTAGNYTGATTSLALIDAANLQPRIECSGSPLRLTLRGRARHSLAGSFIIFAPFIDGAIGEAGASDMFSASTSTAAGDPSYLNVQYDLLPTAGSHLVGWAWRTNAATPTLDATATDPLQMVIEEIIRPNADNT